ncbi:MAG: protein kinase [Anaerolineales bacterium]|nr:protein kinase [Anaerolineales bacterium]
MIGEIINERYRLSAELGQGGMGTVYLARDTVLNRDVALKLVSSPRLGTDGRSRLLSEAQTVAQLKHPNIVTVFDAGEVEKQPYVVMEYIQGDTLNEYQLDGLGQIIDVAKQICAALEYAHTHDIIHRDLKPENVIIQPDGSLQLMDFGLAISTTSRLTENGLIMGTVVYMSPEQAFGYELTPASDLYSLGVMLYELTTGSLPFEAEDALGVITQHINAPVVPPIAKNEDLPGSLNDLIVSLLSKNPADRPASAADVRAMLEDEILLETAGTHAKELSVLDRIVRGRILGREQEFAEVRALWLKSIAGQEQTVLLSGEPGIGKTRLMREIATNAGVSGGTTLIGECYAESNAPYNAFSQIIRQGLQHHHQNGNGLPDAVLDDLLDLTPDLRHHYGDIQANPNLDPETEQQRLFENMVVFCNAIAKESPLLLVVDDAHWADSGTLAMLHHLIRRTQNLPLMILVTYREIELKEARPFNEMLLELNRQRKGTRLKLKRLDREQTHQMLKAIFAEEISEDFLDGIYRETEGNPFFIEEVCRTLVESGDLYYEDGEWHRPSMDELEIPQGVQIAVESRLEKLPPDHQEALRMASILGREFEFEVLLDALDLDEDTLIEALETAEEAQMIQEVDGLEEVTFAFVHALVPSAIADSIRTLRRRKMHHRAAKAIEAISPEDYESLAYHYGEAGIDEQAYQYYKKAGDRALGAFANQDAENFYLSALDLVEEAGEEAHLLLVLGISFTYQDKYQQAIKTWQKAIDIYQELGEIDKVAELYARSARTEWDGGDTKSGLDICRQGLSIVEGTADGPGFAHLLSEACRASYFNGLHEDSSRYGHEALQMAEKLNLPTIQADSLTTLGLLHDLSPDKAVEYLERAVEIAEANNLVRAVLRAHNNLSVLCVSSLGDIPRGTYHLQQAIDLCQQIGDAEYILFERSNLTYNLIHQGKLDEAAKDVYTLKKLRDSLPGNGFGSINLYNVEYYLLTYQGQLDQALELIQDRIEKDRQVGDLQNLVTSLFTITQIYLITGDYNLGKSFAEQLIELADLNMASKSVSRSLLSRIYSRTGNVDKGQELLDQAHRMGEITQTHFYDQVFMLWALAELYAAEEKWEAAWQTYEELVNLTGEKNFRWFSRQASVDWAQALRKRGEPEDVKRAREILQESLQDYQEMGAEGFVKFIEDKLSQMK